MIKRIGTGPRMSEAVCIGDIAFLAGQVPDDLGADITEQTKQVLANMDAVVKELGASKADIASIQVWLADMADFKGIWNISFVSEWLPIIAVNLKIVHSNLLFLKI